ncbi:MAG: GNAT family N-acetyltransferase [Anaerolineales bacterium]|nr:GNAT family N-acetyltransferase [Anaerolineales bacterium]
MTLRNAPLRFQTYDPFAHMQTVESVWLDLQSRSEHTYFTSWGWISVWLNSLPRETRLELVVGYLGDVPALAFFVGKRQKRKYGLLPSKIFSLNSTAVQSYDEIYAEYNSILYDPSALTDRAEVMRHLSALEWDEFDFPWVSAKFERDFDLLNRERRYPFFALATHSATSYFVDLQKIRAANLDFYALLSSNKRSQIRRSVKQYESNGGALVVHEAASAAEALEMFERLVALHQTEWNKLGRPGAFANRYVYQFHRELIRSRFTAQEIQLLHVFNSAGSLGYLYCFTYRGHILFYQSGFNYLPQNVYRPGLVSHYRAIVYNASKGGSVYDFLAGDAPYKQSFSTDSAEMYKIRLVKNEFRFSIENLIVRAKRAIQKAPGLEERLKRARYRIKTARAQAVR